MASDLFAGRPINLLAENEYSRNPWPGYSRTAGVNYDLGDEPVPPENQPLNTGIVPQGGIPALDEQLRPEIYQQGGPNDVNAQAEQTMAQTVPAYNFDGSYAAQTASDVEMGNSPAPNDMGIIPTPQPGG
jgi:hypothetical protein